MCALAQMPADLESDARTLFNEQRWEELASLLGSAPARSTDADYFYGMALAHLGRWREAEAVLRSGLAKASSDKRFPIELAGVSFRLKDNASAKRYLLRALVLDPRDSYANEFLATVYFLEGNAEAALKYWNRVDKPVISTVRNDPRPRLKPVLLDRAFPFAPGDLLSLYDYRTAQARLDFLEIFPRHRLELAPQSDGRFDVTFRNTERNGFGNSKIETLVNLLRRLPFQTITPEYYNLNRSAANIISLYRFDAQKRRLFAEFSAPRQRDPKWRYAFTADLRKEIWELAPSPEISFQNFSLESVKADASLTRTFDPDWRWTTAVQFSDRRFLNVAWDSGVLTDLLHGGRGLKYIAELTGTPLRIPERRFTTTTAAHFSTGKFWSAPTSSSFATITGDIRSEWLPQARGDDYAVATQFRAGRTFGSVPFDELFTLGVERDNNLWLRGHSGTRNGRKGSAPLGRSYVLFNSELNKHVHEGGFFRIKAGPFLDVGRMYDSSPVLGSKEWLVDIGIQLKFTVFGAAGITLSYGRGLVDHRSAFYASPLR